MQKLRYHDTLWYRRVKMLTHLIAELQALKSPSSPCPPCAPGQAFWQRLSTTEALMLQVAPFVPVFSTSTSSTRLVFKWDGSRIVPMTALDLPAPTALELDSALRTFLDMVTAVLPRLLDPSMNQITAVPAPAPAAASMPAPAPAPVPVPAPASMPVDVHHIFTSPGDLHPGRGG